MTFSKEWNYYKDQLSGYNNRFALIEYLERYARSRMTIFVINIDNFSAYNRLYGYLVGDEILRYVANDLDRLRFRHMNFFRFDGDEFVYITREFMNFRDIKEFAMGVISFFNHSLIEIDKLEDTSIRISVSIGIAMGSGIITLGHAQSAVKESRCNAKGTYKIFAAKNGYNKEQQENVYWIGKMKKAIEAENLIAYFQPIYNIKTGKVEKFECLARIKENETIVSPVRFMEAVRLSGIYSLVTRTIIQKAFMVFRHNNYEFSINITASDIQLGYLEEFLMYYVNKYGISPSRVVLEILEDIVTLSEGDMIKQLERFRNLGFKIAIDDFGMENSNFSRLLELHPDYLKIDGVFIKDILTSKKSQIIVNAILDVCKKSSIEVIAEFVANKKIYDYIEKLGVDYAQGYYIGKPLENIDKYATDNL